MSERVGEVLRGHQWPIKKGWKGLESETSNSIDKHSERVGKGTPLKRVGKDWKTKTSKNKIIEKVCLSVVTSGRSPVTPLKRVGKDGKLKHRKSSKRSVVTSDRSLVTRKHSDTVMVFLLRANLLVVSFCDTDFTSLFWSHGPRACTSRFGGQGIPTANLRTGELFTIA